MAQTTPRAGTTKEIWGREDMAGEGVEQKSSTRRRSLTKVSPGTAKGAGAISGEQKPKPTGACKLPDDERTNA